MQDKLTLVVCSYFLPEAKAVVADDIFKDVEVTAFAADCDQPIKKLSNIDGSPLELTTNSLLVGGTCLKQINAIADKHLILKDPHKFKPLFRDTSHLGSIV